MSLNIQQAEGKMTPEKQFIPSGSVLQSIGGDNEVRILTHNMMELYEGTTIKNKVLECQRKFQE